MALLLASAAVVGLLLGCLIRGPQPLIERKYPRIAVSAAYLRDAQNKELSTHTRMRCVFESVYFCCIEVAERHGCRVAHVGHPSLDVIRAGLVEMKEVGELVAAIEVLANWAGDANPLLPPLRLRDACKLAVRVHAATVSMLS